MAEDLVSGLSDLAGAGLGETEHPVQRMADGLWMEAPALDPAALARVMMKLGGRLSTITALPLADGETALIYHYLAGGQAVNVRVATRENTVPSISGITRSASWIEREIYDLYGVSFCGHPCLARLIRPPSMQPGMFRIAG